MTCTQAREALAADEPCEGLESHLAACPGCRDAAVRYRRVQARLRGEAVPVPRRRTWIPLAAAASFLAAVGLWMSRPAPDPAPPSPSAAKGFPREAGAVEILSPSAYARAKPGTRARVLAEDRIELEAGTLYVRAESVRVSLEDGEIEGRGASFQVSVADRGRGLLREAGAAEPGVEILVESGSVSLGGVRIPPGCRLLSGTAVPVAPEALASALAWRDGEAAWRPLGSGAVPWPARFVWEAKVKLSSGAYLEIALPSGGAMTLGAMQGLSDGREHALALRWDAMPSLRVDGREVQSFPYRAPGSGSAGLKAMGGSLQVLDLRWRPLP